MARTTADFAGLAHASAERIATPAEGQRKGFLARFYAGILASRQRRAEAEIARYIRVNGGSLTDDMERRIADVMIKSA